MTRIRKGGVHAAIGAMLVIGMTGCGNDGPYFRWQEYVSNQATGERLLGSGCLEVTDGTKSSSGGGTAPGAGGETSPDFLPAYTIRYVGDNDEVSVSIADADGKVLAERRYTEDFLKSGAVDEVKVDLEGGSLRAVFSGGEGCKPAANPDAG